MSNNYVCFILRDRSITTLASSSVLHTCYGCTHSRYAVRTYLVEAIDCTLLVVKLSWLVSDTCLIDYPARGDTSYWTAGNQRPNWRCGSMALAWEHYLAPCLRGTSWPPVATIGKHILTCASRVVPLTHVPFVRKHCPLHCPYTSSWLESHNGAQSFDAEGTSEGFVDFLQWPASHYRRLAYNWTSTIRSEYAGGVSERNHPIKPSSDATVTSRLGSMRAVTLPIWKLRESARPISSCRP